MFRPKLFTPTLTQTYNEKATQESDTTNNAWCSETGIVAEISSAFLLFNYLHTKYIHTF